MGEAEERGESGACGGEGRWGDGGDAIAERENGGYGCTDGGECEDKKHRKLAFYVMQEFYKKRGTKSE